MKKQRAKMWNIGEGEIILGERVRRNNICTFCFLYQADSAALTQAQLKLSFNNIKKNCPLNDIKQGYSISGQSQ